MKTAVLFSISLLMLLTGCRTLDRGPQMVNLRGTIFGTYYSITYFDEEGRDYQTDIDSLLNEFNQSLSFYEEESLLSRLNRNETRQVDEYFETVFNRSMEISAETGGAFDVTVFPLIDAYGFGLSERTTMTKERRDSLMEIVGYEKVYLENRQLVKEDERVQLDFNAIAKGYAADVVGRFLESKEVKTYLVEIGGDLVAKGTKPDGSQWRIGLEIPAAEEDAPQDWEYYVEVIDMGLATSGDYRRYYEEEGQRYSHTIDPETGRPVDHHMMSATVFAPDGMSADGYATAFMVMGVDEAIAFVEGDEDLEGYFIFESHDDDFEYYASSGLELLTRDDL